MDILIESTKRFEKDIKSLSEKDKAITITKINNYANLLVTQPTVANRYIHRLPLVAQLNGYESSLSILKVSYKLRAILTIDEDPIFGQIIITLFRVVQRDDLDKAYQGIAESLYQDLRHHQQEVAAIA